jgi:cytochrome b561
MLSLCFSGIILSLAGLFLGALGLFTLLVSVVVKQKKPRPLPTPQQASKLFGITVLSFFTTVVIYLLLSQGSSSCSDQEGLEFFLVFCLFPWLLFIYLQTLKEKQKNSLTRVERALHWSWKITVIGAILFILLETLFW